uniref:Uncharacterized protein n=1 Tax=Chenopodium quinoa TaxID=63459 RepID=A0A803KPP3_CHEQI
MLLHVEDFAGLRIIGQSGFAAYMRDVDGFIPILRAAHSGQTLVVFRIHYEFPTSIRMSDYSGRTVLHHLCTSVLKDGIGELESTLKKLGDDSIVMSDLMSSQDLDGNTPLHVGILNRNFEAVQCFIKHFINAKSKELFIHLKNNDGKSVWDMISNGSDIPPILKKLMKQLLSLETTLDDKLYEAATNGDFFNFTYEELNAQTPDGSNIFHIALRHHQFSFFERALNLNLNRETFDGIYKEDSKGDTPLHIAAKLQPSDLALEFLKLCIQAWKKLSYSRNPPWTVRNPRGDTFLHEAARAGNTNIISFFWALPHIDNNEITDHNDISSFLALSTADYGVKSALKKFDITDVNDNGETVLHVIARYATYAAKDFLEKHSQLMKSLVYKRDYEGFTPVLRAVQCGRLGMARLLVQHSPASAELRDYKGRTILHHLRALVVDLADDLRDILPVWKDFFKHSEVDSLRIVQNEDGNTPLHLAIIDADHTKAKFLMEVCLQSTNKQELDIVNNDGHTVFDLLSTRAHLPTMKQLLPLVNRSNVKERETMNKMMDEDLYKAAIKGSVEIFKKGMAEAHTETDVESGQPKLDEDYFCRQTPGGNNIVHIALRHGSANAEQFVEIALEHFPILSMRSDNYGDTPLHVAVKCKGGESGKLLVNASKRFLGKLEDSQKSFHVAPWAVKNYKGNFPIHEALQTNNLKDAFILLECDDEAASRVNDLGETPLHSFAKNDFSKNDKEADEFMMKNKAIEQAAFTRDDQGLTPLLRAASSGRFAVARAILNHQPQSAYLRDPSGRTFLHMLRFTGEDVDESFAGTFKKTGKQLFEIAEADAQRLVQDYEGNTPLHYAIKTGNSIAAIVLTKQNLD